MKRALLTTVTTLGLFLGVIGCKTPHLEPGGPYSTGTNAVSNASDLAFYTSDSAFYLAYSAIDMAFRYEQSNRAALWALNPNIKKSLDAFRPHAKEAVITYTTARAAYLSHPTPQNLDNLNRTLTLMQQLSTAITAVITKK